MPTAQGQGLKPDFPQERVIRAIRRVVQYWWTKLNPFISAELSVTLFSSVSESYTYK